MKSSHRYGYAAWYYHVINIFTYMIYCLCKPFKRKIVSSEIVPSPLLITGLFRSGTTITARLVQTMGYQSGPESHLLQASGKRKHLNPNGFLEDYFFMECTLAVFAKTNSWGDAPPDKNTLKQFDLRQLNQNEIVKFSLLQIHDDRISNYNKLKVLLSGEFNHPEGYLKRFYTDRSFIKNPHFAVLMPVLESIFSKSNILVVFKEPAKAILSAKKVSSALDFNLYLDYYKDLVERHKSGCNKIMFFSYESLILNTSKSIDDLSNSLNGKVSDKQKLIDLVKTDIVESEYKTDLPNEVTEIYQYMLTNSINSVK